MDRRRALKSLAGGIGAALVASGLTADESAVTGETLAVRERDVLHVKVRTNVSEDELRGLKEHLGSAMEHAGLGDVPVVVTEGIDIEVIRKGHV